MRWTAPFIWFFKHWWKLALVALACMGAYAILLDAEINARFEGNTWQVPAQIYARPLKLTEGQDFTPQELLDELHLLSYRQVSHMSQSGDFQQGPDSIAFYRRGFDFPGGYEPQRKIRVQFNQGKITAIKDLDNQQNIEQIHLEPWLVSRLVNANQEDRMLVALEDVPESLVQALLLTEDKDFYQHYGIAPLSILRALIANISAGAAVQGGSTLTQQLIKNLFLTREKSLIRKAKEALMALVIEQSHSKDEILEAYLNEVFLGQNGAHAVHGFSLASRFYFDRPLNELNLSEVATMVGMIKGPSYYNPRRYPERAIERRNLVLRLLFENNNINAGEYQHWIAQPLNTVPKGRLSRTRHPAFMDQVRRELARVLVNPDIRQSGVRVFTTLDHLAQLKAEKAIENTLPRLSNEADKLEAAMVVTDIASGEIRALVGGRDADYAGFNRALDARRSIGSLIKPAIYLTALEQSGQYNLATPLKDQPISMRSTFGEMWEPKNADKKFRGQVPLLQALTKSLNVPTVNLGLELGLGNVVDGIHRLGVNESIQPYPAMTLGAVNFSPLQVNQMYQTIANNGRYIPLHALTAVTSSDGQLIWQYRDLGEQRMDEKATYLINYALHKVTLEGTAKVLKQQFPGVNLAGKTGTTDDYRDSWFSGFDKYSLASIWVGRDDNAVTHLTGGSGALRVYSDYQKRQHPKSLTRRFPAGLAIAHFNEQTGVRVNPGCSGSLHLPAIVETLPAAASCADKPPEKNNKKSLWEKLFGE